LSSEALAKEEAGATTEDAEATEGLRGYYPTTKFTEFTE